MIRFQLRFERSTDKVVQTISIDAATTKQALNYIPRDAPIHHGQLWCDGAPLFDLVRLKGDARTFWVLSEAPE